MRHVTTVVVGALVAGLIALGLVLDGVMPSSEAGQGEPTPRTAGAGAWVCAAGDTREGSTLAVVAAAPPVGQPDDEPVGGEPATLALVPFSDGEALEIVSTQVFPNGAVASPVEPRLTDVGVVARWWDVPTAVTRNWVVDVEGAPGGIVAGPCQPALSDRWVVPGVATAGGAQARLVLANPFSAAASVTIDLTTSDGLVSPKRLENVVVPAQSTATVELNRHAPEQADLGAIVTVRSGRVVVDGLQIVDAAIGGIEGRSLALAAPQAAETWTIPAVANGENESSWLWVTNPSDEPAALLLALHTPTGGIVPEGLEEIVIDPGVTQRVELVGLLEETVEHASVTVSSDNGVPVVVSAATQYRAEDPARTGLTVALGSPVLDTSWVLSPGPLTDRQAVVDLANPSGAPAEVDLAIWGGGGLQRPDELAGLEVPAGGRLSVDVSEFLADPSVPVTVFVLAVDRVAAGIRAYRPEGVLDPVAFAGIPARVFEVGAPMRRVSFAPDLSVRLGTRSGPTDVSDPLLEDTDVGDEFVEDLDLEP
ncbi:MAG: DUF5719 family protein [Nitriliruptorales bacterium]|nr:DUF5719 family protein [Nitriliruptorales bacterium]